MVPLKRVLQRGLERVLDRPSRQQALKIFAVVEKDAGRISPRMRRRAEQYAAEVLGSRRFAPWLLVYSAVSGEFREGWIPDTFFGRVVIPRVNHGTRHVSSIKTFTRVVFETDAIPDQAYLIDGHYYDRDFRLMGATEAPDIIFGEAEQVIVKSDGSRQGRGVKRLARAAFEARALAQQGGNAVFQRSIAQHAFFARCSSGLSTTLRITTVKNRAGGCEARAAYLRYPRDGEEFVRSASHVRVAIDLANGRTSEFGYLSDWTKVTHHPDSRVRFERAPVPAFSHAVDLCVSLHARSPQIGVIGWDVMVDEDERVWVIEWNARHPDIKFSEATCGPCFTGLGWERLRPADQPWVA